jgi:hypothetical protein
MDKGFEAPRPTGESMMREPRYGASNALLKEIIERNKYIRREPKKDGRGRKRIDGLVGNMAILTVKELDELIIRIGSAETETNDA